MADGGQWLHAGLGVLRAAGARGLTIERLVAEVGLTKGSFYHHFGGMAGYRTALLAYYESTDTSRLISAAEQPPPVPARARLRRLLELVCAPDEDWHLEVAVRAWAQRDAEVREAQERIDRLRVEYLRTLLHELTGDPRHAERLASMIYLLLVGAGQVLPPVSPPELGQLYELLLAMVATHEPPGSAW